VFMTLVVGVGAAGGVGTVRSLLPLQLEPIL
jgi:hypothetical protein